MNENGEKNSWPEVVGFFGDEAVEIIKNENSSLDVVIVGEGQPVTRDFRLHRVRVFVDNSNKVVLVPRCG